MKPKIDSALPATGLAAESGREIAWQCKVCNGPSRFFDTARIMGRYDIRYFRCDTCGLIETENPYWLTEAYSDAIAESDIGLAGRNIDLCQTSRIIIQMFFRDGKKFVDYGGGYGLFVRLMRDKGFNFVRYDKYCANLFAKGFDLAPGHSNVKFDLLTAFEVFEHLVNPLQQFEEMLSLSRNILFTTCLISKGNPLHPADWWYYALQSGQHVTIYTIEALRLLAKANNLYLNSAGHLHLFTEKPIDGWLFQLLFKFKTDRLFRLVLPRRKSLLGDDFNTLTGQTIT